MTEVLTYEALKADRDALSERVERLSGMLTESRHATKAAVERADALAVENAELKEFIRQKCFVVPAGASCLAEADEPAAESIPETPATDAALAAIRTDSHIAGLEAAANRIGVISLRYRAGQKQELIKAIGRDVLQYAAELREAK